MLKPTRKKAMTFGVGGLLALASYGTSHVLFSEPLPKIPATPRASPDLQEDLTTLAALASQEGTALCSEVKPLVAKNLSLYREADSSIASTVALSNLRKMAVVARNGGCGDVLTTIAGALDRKTLAETVERARLGRATMLRSDNLPWPLRAFYDPGRTLALMEAVEAPVQSAFRSNAPLPAEVAPPDFALWNPVGHWIVRNGAEADLAGWKQADEAFAATAHQPGVRTAP